MFKCCDASEVVLVCIWIFRDSGSAKFVVLLGVGPVTRFPTTSPWVLWDGRPLSHAVLFLLLVALALVMFHTGIPVLVVCSLRVQELAPASVELKLRKKVEASELLQALSLLQRIMTPEDFVKYQVLVAPKPKPGKTREQELADRVKSLNRLRTQETS